MILFVVLDLLGGPVFLVIRIRDAVAVVAVSVDFENGWFVFFPSAFHGDVRLGADFIEIGAVHDIPLNGVSFSALGKAAIEGGGTLLRGSHGVAVVFDDVNDRDSEKGSDVQGLVESALVHGAVTKVAEAAALATEILETVGKAKAERGLTCDDPVATPEIFVRGEEMHRAALAL